MKASFKYTMPSYLLDFIRHYIGSEQNLALLLNYFRRKAKKRNLLAHLHKFRQLIHFAPWRVVPIYLIQKLRPPEILQETDKSRNSLLGEIDEKVIAAEVHQNSVAMLGQLPSNVVTNLRKITDDLPPEEYQLVHQVNEDVLRITQDPGVKKVLRAYFKSEPVLLESSLFVSRSEQ
jgi:hypothetical protein